LVPDDRKESEIEKKFRIACRRYGGLARKLTSPGSAGVLDRFVVWNNGVTTYAELKRPTGGVVSELQSDEIRMLSGMGHLAQVVTNEMDIARFVKASLERVLHAHL
jgi:hypothetical protein